MDSGRGVKDNYETIVQLYEGLQARSILGPLFKMLEASFELFVPLVVARMVDVGIRGRDSGYILKMGGVLVLLALIGLACSLTAQYFAAKAATGAATSLRNDLFSHIGRLSYTEIDTVGTSTLITRMTSDINQVQSGINMTLRLLLRSPFVVFWGHGYGLYRGCALGLCFRGHHTGALRGGVRHHGSQHAAL